MYLYSFPDNIFVFAVSDKNRIDFKGYGNSKMLYPDPKSSYQESANRRVEIKILSDEYNPGDRNIH